MRRVLTALPRALRRRFLVTVAVSGGGLLATGFLLPWFTQLFTDRYLIAGQGGWLGALLSGMALAALARAALTWAQRRLLLRVQQTVSRQANTLTIRALLAADQRVLAQWGAAAPGYLPGRQHRAHALLYGEVAQGISDLPTAPLLLLVMAWFDPLLAGLACVLASVNALAYTLVDRRRAGLGDALAAASGRVASIVAQDLAVLPTIKASAAEALVQRRWLAAYEAQAAAAHRLALSGQVLAVVPHALSGLGVAALLAAGAWRVINGAISVGDLVACQTLLFSINDGLQRFIEASRLYPQAAAELRRQQVLRALPRDDLAIGFDGEDRGMIPAALTGELRVKDLPLAGRPVRLALPAGSQLAVAADEQSHTHALCRALAGLEPALAAAVALGGVALDGMVPRVRSALIALVGEGSIPLDDTLRENIRLWDKRIGDREVKRALYLAGFEEALELPDGLDRPLGRHELSGGQLRRVALAQALIRRPRLIILDAALEALDLALVRRILQRLEQAGLTVIVVSPRPDVLALCQYRLVSGEAGWSAQPQTLP